MLTLFNGDQGESLVPPHTRGSVSLSLSHAQYRLVCLISMALLLGGDAVSVLHGVGDVDHPLELHDQHHLLAVHLGVSRG